MTVLAYVFLDATAASIIMVTLLPLATVPVLVRSSLSIRTSDEAESSNSESNHVRVYDMYVASHLSTLICSYLSSGYV